MNAKVRINDLPQDAPNDAPLTLDRDVAIVEIEVPDQLNWKGTLNQISNQYIVVVDGRRSWHTLANPSINAIDPDSGVNNNIVSGGTSDQPVYIGSSTVGILNYGGGRDTDPTYPAGSVLHASILSGYDGLVNAIASTMVSAFHNLIAYSTGGHHFIGGGSFHRILGGSTSASAYCVIVGGTRNTINDGKFNFIGGGTENYVDVPSGAEGGSAILGGRLNRIEGGHSSAIIYGANNRIGASPYALAGGNGSQALNFGTIALGENVISRNVNQISFGKNIDCPSNNMRGAIVTGFREHTNAGDSFRSQVRYVGTTSEQTAPAEDLTTDGGVNDIKMPYDNCVMTGVALITARDSTTGAVAVWSLDCVFKRVGGTTTRLKGAIADRTEIVNEGNWYTGSGVQCGFGGSVGNLYFQAWGMADRVIEWSVDIDWSVLGDAS